MLNTQIINLTAFKKSKENFNTKLKLIKQAYQDQSVHSLDCFPQTFSEWDRYLSELDSPLKEELILDSKSFDAAAETRTINQLWQELSTDHPLKHTIQDAIESLPKMEKEILHLVFWERQTLRNIAKHLKVSKVTVERYRDKALAKLKKHLTQESLINS